MTPPAFAFHVGNANDREVKLVSIHCALAQRSWQFFRRGAEVPEGAVPVGTIEWVEQVLGRPLAVDYYPGFLAAHLHRRVWLAERWPTPRCFVKPARKHKHFTGFVKGETWRCERQPERDQYGTRADNKRGPFWCSEVVTFTNEWRYYVADGRVVAAHWYAGDEAQEPAAPRLAVEWPEGYCGAVDFGMLPDGRVALVEAQPPCACGWYGSSAPTDIRIFVDWPTCGWAWLRSRSS